MSAALAVNVVVLDEANNPVVLTAGSEVPDWATDQVGEHCFEQDEPDKPARGGARKRTAQ